MKYYAETLAVNKPASTVTLGLMDILLRTKKLSFGQNKNIQGK